MTTGHYVCAMRRKIHREDILNAGLDLMFLQGYNGTGIKDITDRIEIPKGSFYNHFSSKEEFALEVVKNYCDNGIKLYQQTLLKSDLPPLERVDEFFKKITENYRASYEYKLGCIMSNFSAELSDTNEKFRSLLDQEFDRCESIIAECLQQAQAEGSLDKDLDIQHLAGYILNGWHGALVRMKSTGNVKPLEVFRAVTIGLLLK